MPGRRSTWIDSLEATGREALVTIAALGELGAAAQPLALRALVDEAVDRPDSVQVRFVNAAVGAPALDVLAGSGGASFPVFTGVKFGETGAGNASGYYVTTPLRVQVGLRSTGSAHDHLTLPALDLPAGQSLTAYASRRPRSGSSCARTPGSTPPRRATSSLRSGRPGLLRRYLRVESHHLARIRNPGSRLSAEAHRLS